MKLKKLTKKVVSVLLVLILANPLGECKAYGKEISEETSLENSFTEGNIEVSLNEGIFKDSQETGEAYLLTYDVDRLAVSLFRYSSKKDDAPVDMNNGYGGWENSGENGIGGHTYGHYMSACVAMYRETGNEKLKENVERAVELLKLAQDDDGFVGGFSRKNLDYVFENPNNFWAGGNNDAFLQGIWAPWYTIHKLMAGLLDAYEYLGIEDALVCAQKIASYAKAGTDKLNDEQMEKMLTGEHGGINESFAKLYELTGKEEYIELAKRFSHKKIMDPLSRGEDILPGIHANTTIPKIIGAAKIYLLTGDEYYKNVAENFWKFVVENQTYANGGVSNYEYFTENDQEPLSEKNCETCCAYNMLKLTEYLYQWNQSSEYIDYYENVLYNQILGSQNSQGNKTYSVDLSMGASTVYLGHDGFECCLGTGMENPGRYSRMIYYGTQDELYVNLFINSTVKWQEKNITLTQQTQYPKQDTTVLTVDGAEGEKAVLKVRIPQWAGETEVSLNGVKQDAVVENGYLKLERTWQKGDRVEIRLPMELSLYESRGDKNVVAFKYGGILLAGDLGSDTVKDLVVENRDPSTYIEKTGDGLEFAINGYLQPGDGSITLKPFYEFQSERHMVYWNLEVEEESNTSLKLQQSFVKRLNQATIDFVNPGHLQSELDHNYQSEGDTSQGIYDPAAQSPATGSWRDVRNGYISYDLKIQPDETNYLVSMFWGSDNGSYQKRMFDILVEDTVLQEDYVLDNNLPGQIEYLYLEIPKELTQGKDKVTVKYRAADNCNAGGIYGVRTVTTPVGEISWDTKAGGNDNSLEKAGDWQVSESSEAYNSLELTTQTAGAWVSCSFTGKDYVRLSLKGDQAKDGAEIYLDGEKVWTVRQNQVEEKYQVVWESDRLDKNQHHELKLVSLGSFGFDYIQFGNEEVTVANATEEPQPTPTQTPVPTQTATPTPTQTPEPVATQTPKKPQVKKITLECSGKTIAAGKKVTVKAVVTTTGKNADKKVSWTTSNSNYATVNAKGVVTTKKAAAGKTVTITAKALDGSGKKASVKLKIVKHRVKKINLSPVKTGVKAGKKITIKAVVATTGKTAGTSLSWTTSNSNYATVNAKGVVTTKKAGKGKTVTITAASTDGTGKKAKVKIKIK